MKLMRRLSLIIIFLLLPIWAWGGTVYVGKSGATMYRNTTGCPVVATDTASTIQAAVVASSTGGITNICAGTYSGTDIVNPAATMSFSHSNQTLKSESGIKSDVILDGGGVADDVINADGAGATIQNLTIKNAPTGKYAIDVTVAATVTGVDLIDNARAMYIRTNAGGTYTRLRVKGTTDTGYTLAIAGTAAPTIWNYCIFERNAGPINIIGAVTSTWNNCNFIGFADLSFTNNQVTTQTFNNPIFSANNLNGANTVVVQTGAKGTWTFNNGILGDTAIYSGSFLGNTGGVATVAYNNSLTSYSPKFKAYRSIGKVFFMLDDTPSLANWYTLADLANGTYGYPVGIALFVSGTEGYSASDWTKLAGYITTGNEVAGHGYSGVRLYTAAGDDAAGTVNAITGAKAGSSVVIAVTRTNPADSSTWTGTLTLDAEAPIDLANASYDTMNEVIAYLVGKGVTVGSGTGQIAYDDSTMKAKSLCLKAGTYNVNSAISIPFDQTSLFVVEMKESKAWFESKLGSTINSFVWSGGFHGANAEAYAIATAGYAQVRGVNQISTTDYKTTALGFYRVGSIDAPNGLSTTDATITIEAKGIMDTLAQFRGVSGIHSHSFTAFSLANWTAVFNAVQASPWVGVLTFNGAMDWVRANDDHVTSNISYYCSTGTDSCITDLSNFQLSAGSPAINAGTDVSLTTDYLGKPIRGTVDIGAYEYQGSGDVLGGGIRTFQYNNPMSGNNVGINGRMF